MVTILNIGGLDEFKHRLDSAESIIIPIFSDASAHPCDNRLCLLYVRFLDDGNAYVIPFDHSESPTLIVPSKFLSGDKNKFVPNRKEIRHTFLPLMRVLDVNLLQYVSSGQSTPFLLEDTVAHKVIKRNYPNQRNINRIIPLSKHIEACEVLSSKMLIAIDAHRHNVDEPSFKFLNYSATDVFQQIEYAGIHTCIPVHGLAYTEYNLFTTTGRPSNRFGGVNYAALNKEDGTRKQFTSRFDNGMMVYIDYDAYHLRLIAELIGFKFPPGNVHTYLGTMYFKTDTLTEEQYNESKRVSFHMLYGGITEEYREVPFFKEVQKFIDYLWDEFRDKGYIVSPIGQRKIYAKNVGQMHPQKLFNYFIQLHETEHNVMTLERVLPMFFERQSRLVLYTYDSVLIDFNPADGIDFIRKVKSSLECENTYPTKVYVGADYHTMSNVTDRFQ
jgi:hypothetical protein